MKALTAEAIIVIGPITWDETRASVPQRAYSSSMNV